jgi:membrane associated rhomboid family serine protease
MLIPLRTDSPLRSTPWVNWALILANVIVFGVTTKWPELKLSYELNPVHPHLLNYFTYQFLHENIPHILFNMLFLYVFGNNVNDRMGNLGYLAFYLAGGVFSGIAYVFFEKANILGASGAIAAVIGAYLVLLPRSHITIVYLIFFIGVAEIPSIWLILGYFVLQDAAMQFFHTASGSSDNVAHVAHLGGTLFGLTVCMLMLSVHLLPRDQFDVLALLQRWNKRRQYQDLVRKGYDPFAYTPPRRTAPDPNVDRIHDLRADISELLAAHKVEDAARQYINLQEIDSRQVLSRQNQLDVANQLYSDRRYPEAAKAYELFVQHYPKYESLEHVRLMMGILYARYLGRFDAAREQLNLSLERLHTERERDMAKAELERIGPPPMPPPILDPGVPPGSVPPAGSANPA